MLWPGECDVFPGRDCVQSVIVRPDGTPFATKEEADAEAATWPDWCAPHTMPLSPSTRITGRSADAVLVDDYPSEAQINDWNIHNDHTQEDSNV